MARKSKINMDESIRKIFIEFGRQGGQKSLKIQTIEQRREAGRKGALKRWQNKGETAKKKD